jgi:phosphoglycerol transferase MdoB-like AlkP superfamily enzyme
MARSGRRWPWLLAAWAIAATAAIVYAAQMYSLYVSRNFISALAMENADSVAFIASPLLLAIAAAAAAWLLLFCVGSVVAARRPAGAAGAETWGRVPLAAAVFAVGLLFVYALFLQDKNRRLEPGFRQAPMVNLAVNAWNAEAGAAPEPALVAAATDSGPRCFTYGDQGAAGAYPFERRRAYAGPLPFPARPGAVARPNVLVIFSEGVSSRLVGAYGGSLPGLTPNIDTLAGRAMQVEDYFNHTAATFRGLAGQLSSGYSYAGGGGKEGWIKEGNREGLARIRRQTLPLVFGAAGYDTVFFAPHKANRPLLLMLRSLGFGKVFHFESIGAELLGGHVAQRPGTGALSDQSLFRGLVAFLRQRAASGDTAPFFAATYNIGTHAFLDSAPGDVHYAGGNAALDKLHNYDAAFGEFLRYFLDSPYADNTLLVFTSDHSTYPEPPFREVAGPDLKPYFVDRIPLLVLDPRHVLPDRFDAQGRNSLDLAPTVLQLAGLQTDANSFLGRSLFEPRNFPTGVAAIASKYYMTTPAGVFAQGEIPAGERETFRCEIDVVRRFYEAERENRIFRGRHGAGA